jgi:hypothetical protein
MADEPNDAEPRIVVTDHALVRYLERVKGLDREAVEAEMLTDDLVEQVRVLGGTGRFVSEGRRVIVKEHHVLTIYDNRNRRKAK